MIDALTDAWRLAVGTLTAVPVRPPRRVDRRTAAAAMVLAPLAAVPLGAVVVAVLLAGDALDLPLLVTALLAIAALVAGNRAFHLDGLSDTVDGLAASHDRERSLAVMKTGTSGPAGTAAVVLVLGVQAAALAVLVGTWRAAVLAGVAVCASRAALAVCCARGVPAARADGLGVTYTSTVPRAVVAAAWAALAVVLAAVGVLADMAWWRGPVAIGSALVVVLVLVRHTTRRFGGVTGDVFGAAVELALAALLVALA
ncbi:adenosylcobinamide-GDP ribazoletransferase [Nocardioides mangrovi]|uniref:Adenosylcobinamide-GDP ribazoletransferase n=1 Tax=Nocardioides mangrovi TaxID=2874580 RepID=A0ABS7U6G3_9ACTN|nr:adenosylcobinamide-GDP ribazoletransferase [Nocardioides mangrovi]MBZ5736549.1 adenosylcobinamide-GDP ribazoletransferase [Nocardioides mangrovi]